MTAARRYRLTRTVAAVAAVLLTLGALSAEMEPGRALGFLAGGLIAGAWFVVLRDLA